MSTTYMVKDEMKSRYGPQYVHFHSNCLKEYAMRKHEKEYQMFPFDLIIVNKKTLSTLNATGDRIH